MATTSQRILADAPQDIVAVVNSRTSFSALLARSSKTSEEPWRNGAVEHFQDVFDKSFFRTERYRGLGHHTERAASFEAFHNAHHRYSTLGGRTPDEAWAVSGRGLRLPPDGYRLPEDLPRRRRIEAIRLIRSDRVLHLFWG